MTSPRAQRIAAVFRSVIEILPANPVLKTCSLHEYVETTIRQLAAPVMSYAELFKFSCDTHGVLTSIGVEDSFENCTHEQAFHLMELAALVCEDTDGKGIPDAREEAYMILRNLGHMTGNQCGDALDALEKHFTLVPKENTNES